MQPYDQVRRPTLILDPRRVQANIAWLARKAAGQGVRFRPHFKTHQSAEIGGWFRAHGVEGITVSSLEMANYFAASGWDDITVAFPLNLRELDDAAALAEKVRLGLLVESLAGLKALADARIRADVWIKVDTGSNRTGLSWDAPEESAALLGTALPAGLNIRGLLAHAGHTYRAQGAEEIAAVYRESVERVLDLRAELQHRTGLRLEVSTGDTPGCMLSPQLGPVDEIRPGNFVFFDAQQLAAGVCAAGQIAVAAACPVVALHPGRAEVVVYGGAVHLSKDTALIDGRAVYGLVCRPREGGWSEPVPGAWVDRLSQEHGILRMPPAEIETLREGDLLCVLPAHICLTVSAMGRYLSLDGRWIETMHSCPAV